MSPLKVYFFLIQQLYIQLPSQFYGRKNKTCLFSNNASIRNEHNQHILKVI
ncbi:hypothetical protein HanPSC8_Chr05g0207001 [Helianthus annuus]|nr:hypothetical protein HanPSC8_Chr05g0207001 [Helianthus annuus]